MEKTGINIQILIVTLALALMVPCVFINTSSTVVVLKNKTKKNSALFLIFETWGQFHRSPIITYHLSYLKDS